MDLSPLLPPILFLSFLSLYLLHRMNKSHIGSATKISFSEMVRNGHRFLEWTAELVLASPTNTIILPSGIITGNPKNIEHVLKTKFDNYPKGDAVTVLEDFLGRGIFNTDGDHWKLQRKIASLQFNTKTIRNFVLDNVHREAVDRLLPLLSEAAAAGETLDLQDLLDRLAFDNVCKVASDVDPARLKGETEDTGRFAHAFEVAMDISAKRFRQPGLLWKLRRALNIGDERRLGEELATVNEFAMGVVKERKQRKTEEMESSSDLLSRFISEGAFSDEFLRDVIISFVLAGRDTTSSAMAWFLWLVSTRPGVEQKILDEISWVRSRHHNPPGGTLTLDELREMNYLHAVVSEGLRLYPPVPLQPRQCAADDVLPDGTAVKKGMSVTYNTYAMGRMEGIWGEDCKEFKPERWLDGDGLFQPKRPFLFPVFHAGPRTCLGKEMAYTQMKAVVASVIERFEIEVVGEKEREIEFTTILRMKGGLPVKVKEREGGNAGTARAFDH
ncbi:cytochrome P450 94A1-like [Phoenix dactylifera]|uniref:Cytochrome P450 94A1-like n=1 Tax=Phoenix dactylifera TaxID=42345 RepID=A0A8B8J2J1_PHODC|nr:cytochrome P450 94A1-like [Phoenix dactylifera]